MSKTSNGFCEGVDNGGPLVTILGIAEIFSLNEIITWTKETPPQKRQDKSTEVNRQGFN